MITGTASALLLPAPLVRCCCFSKSSNFFEIHAKKMRTMQLAWRELCTFPFAPLQFTFPSLQKFTFTAVRSCWLPRAQCTYAHARQEFSQLELEEGCGWLSRSLMQKLLRQRQATQAAGRSVELICMPAQAFLQRTTGMGC
jgi:hypothetical protein